MKRLVILALVGLLFTTSAGNAGAQDISSRWESFKANFALVTERNRAWPKPFQCHDVQLYYSMWQPMLDRGWENQCTLTDAHFDLHTQQLNRLGIATAMGIAQNTPMARRTIFILDTGDAETIEARTDAVRQLLESRVRNPELLQIATTDRQPHGLSGSSVELLNQRFMNAQPAPVIPTASTSTTTTGK